MKKYKVLYNGGESKKNPRKAVDYMLAVVECNDNQSWRLYEESDDIDCSYEILKDSIIRQAIFLGLKEEQLIFD